jgi:hypothetical protein
MDLNGSVQCSKCPSPSWAAAYLASLAANREWLARQPGWTSDAIVDPDQPPERSRQSFRGRTPRQIAALEEARRLNIGDHY